jgi:hypothetical protein
MSEGLWIAAVVIASLWHPFRIGPRPAATAAGYRLCLSGLGLVCLYAIPGLFDHGNFGCDTSPNGYAHNSEAGWAALFFLSLIVWSGIGVFKAGALSLADDEKRPLAVVSASLAAVAIGLIGYFIWDLSTLCL